jgi:hypothetical protein
LSSWHSATPFRRCRRKPGNWAVPEGRATPCAASAAATALPAAPTYARHAPERTLLYARV